MIKVCRCQTSSQKKVVAKWEGLDKQVERQGPLGLAFGNLGFLCRYRLLPTLQMRKVSLKKIMGTVPHSWDAQRRDLKLTLSI